MTPIVSCALLTREGPAVKVPGLVFVAGQTSANPDIKKATRIVLENLKKVLELAGSSMEQVVKYNGKLDKTRSKKSKLICKSIPCRHERFCGHERGVC